MSFLSRRLCIAAVGLLSSGKGRMDDVSGRSTLADYRVIGGGVAIIPSVSVVIPAKNEARNLPHVLVTIPEWVDEIVLVDGHSVDDTVAVARKLNPSIMIVAQEGRGKGDALQANTMEIGSSALGDPVTWCFALVWR